MSLGTENETTEFVEGMDGLDDALKSVTAMLNRYFKADVFIGVDVNGEPTGCEFSNGDTDRVLKRFVEVTNHMPEVSVVLETDGSGRRYIHISARGYEIPYSYKGWFYVRRSCTEKGSETEWIDSITCGMRHH